MHMLEQHQEQSKEYMSLLVAQKTSYFDSSTGVRKEDLSKGCLFLPLPTDDEQRNIWLVDKAIVEGIIGNLLLIHQMMTRYLDKGTVPVGVQQTSRL
jgi:hypothetical protein